MKTQFVWRGPPDDRHCSRPNECGAGSVCVPCALSAVKQERANTLRAVKAEARTIAHHHELGLEPESWERAWVQLMIWLLEHTTQESP